MSTALGVNCWISEKQWTIPQPSDPDCALFDYGNAVVVRANGIQWPCYSDFIWNPNAPALPYGDGMQVGEFICRSAEDGVSCNNSQDQGFRLARAEVVVF